MLRLDKSALHHLPKVSLTPDSYAFWCTRNLSHLEGFRSLKAQKKTDDPEGIELSIRVFKDMQGFFAVFKRDDLDTFPIMTDYEEHWRSLLFPFLVHTDESLAELDFVADVQQAKDLADHVAELSERCAPPKETLVISENIESAVNDFLSRIKQIVVSKDFPPFIRAESILHGVFEEMGLEYTIEEDDPAYIRIGTMNFARLVYARHQEAGAMSRGKDAAGGSISVRIVGVTANLFRQNNCF